MKPRTLSASALNVAELCLARYHAEHGLYGRGVSGDAAMLGSSVHGALEWYVIKCYIEKVNTPSIDLLVAAYQASFMKTFGTSDMDSPEFQDGLEMIRKWHKRTEFEGFEVLSCEVKENFAVPFPDKTTVPLNYIFDRLDKTGPYSYRVVDYKSQRWALNPQDLDTKIQARIYGLAVQIKYPDAEEIWVVFDLLRHDPVGMRFSKQDNKETWAWLKRSAARIHEFTFDQLEPRKSETLNNECKWCVRKVSCESLQNNAAAGGIFSIEDMADAIERRAQLEYQMKGAKAALDELDKLILEEAKSLDTLEFRSDFHQINIGISSQRQVDADMVENVIGPDLFKKYRSTSITMKDIDGLLKGQELSPDQKKRLESLIYRKTGEPRVKLSKASPFGDK